jgi:Fe(3+) dicitrate transport protein
MRYIFLLLTLSFSVFAQEQDLEVIHVEDEYEAPTWKEQDKTKILTGKKNRTSKINYLPPVQTDNATQVFSQQPSIYTPQAVAEAWVSMNFRGIGDPQEAQYVLLLQDGLPTSVDPYGNPDNYYAPPFPLMEEVQVIAGGGALMYGPSATGTVNFISPRLSKGMETHGRVNAAAGSYNLLSTVNSITGSSGKTSYYAGFYRKQGDGYLRSNNDFSADYLQLKTNTYLDNNAILKFAFQGYNSDFGSPGGMSTTSGANINSWSANNRTSTRSYDRLRFSRAQVTVGLEKKLSSKTQLDANVWASAYRRYNKTQTCSGCAAGQMPTANSNTINNVHAYSFDGDIRINHEWEKWDNKHNLTLGYTSYNTNAPTFTEAGASAGANHGNVTLRSVRSTRVNAFFAENKFTSGRFSIVPGARYENITLTNQTLTKATNTTVNGVRSYNVLLGGLGASYFLTDTTQVYANASQGFRPSTFSEVLAQASPTNTVQGNIDPSYTYTYEAGLRGENEKFNWDSSLFLIHRQNIQATSGTVITNGRSAQYRGAEAAITWKDFLNMKSSHEVDAYLNGTFLNAQYHGGQFKGKTPAYAPSALVKFGLVYRMQRKFKASLMGTYVNEHFADDAHTSSFRVPSYNIYDMLFDYSLNDRFSVNGAVNNILDKHYWTRVQATGIQPLMGRNFYAGLNYRF